MDCNFDNWIEATEPLTKLGYKIHRLGPHNTSLPPDHPEYLLGGIPQPESEQSMIRVIDHSFMIFAGEKFKVRLPGPGQTLIDHYADTLEEAVQIVLTRDDI